MSIKKFALVTTALMGLYGASSAFASDNRDEQKDLKASSQSVHQSVDKTSVEYMRNLLDNLTGKVAKIGKDRDEFMYSINLGSNTYEQNHKEVDEVKSYSSSTNQSDSDFVKVLSDTSFKTVGWTHLFERENFECNYKNQLNAYYNTSWKGFCMNNVSSAAKYVGKAFGGLFY